MPSGNSSDVRFEMGHVLFIDIVGYSKLSINEQSTAVDELNAPDDLDTLMNKTAFIGLHRPDPATNGPTGLAGAQHIGQRFRTKEVDAASSRVLRLAIQSD